MSLEDFGRMMQGGKLPKNRSMLDRWAMSDEDGCAYDQQVFVVPMNWIIGLIILGVLMYLSGWQPPSWLMGLFQPKA